jgi:tetratricopeptide (TPR) repeat protein
VLLRRLSVFAGGWTLEAAEAVCGGAGVDTDAILNLLASLVDKSLVVAEERYGATRYRLLETVRQYAWHQLRQTEEEDICQRRHIAFLVAVAEKAEPQFKGADQQAWLEKLEAEHDNLRSALTWSATAGRDAERGLRLASALWRFWLMRGYVDEGHRFLSGQLAAVHGGQATHRAKALHGAGVMAWQQGDYSGARARLEESLALRRELGDRTAIAETLTNLGIVAHDQGNLRLDQEQHEEALSIRRELGDRWGIAVSLENLGVNAYEQGDYASARALLEESLTISRELATPWGIAINLSSLGAIALEQGDYARARALYEESLKIRRELGDQWGIALSIEGLANLALVLNEPGRAARLWGSAERLREEIGVPLPPALRLRYERQVASARIDMGHDLSFDSAWQEGRAMTLERTVEYALKKPEA